MIRNTLGLFLALFLFLACQKDSPHKELLRAERLHNEKRYAEEIEVYRFLMDRYPQSAEAVAGSLRIGEIYQYSLADRDQALKAYAEVAERWKGKGREALTALERRASLFEAEGDSLSAIGEYERLLSQRSDSSRTDYYLYQLSSCYLKTQEYAKSQSALVRLIKDFPKSDWIDGAWLDLGESFFLQNRFDKALEAYQQLISNFPKSPYLLRARFSSALALEEMAEWDKALKIYEELLSTYPNPKMIELKIDKLKERQKNMKADLPKGQSPFGSTGRGRFRNRK
ncbi:MAG: tetratricopeptide repeat protein [Deltaproteobacteria bacterium]|nr:tetratricopeptide repeat protein [Deltaproteobacteria bacterium]